VITLFEEPWSHWCVKVRKILNYKKIRYEIRPVGAHDKRELLGATGQDYVPALVNGKEIVTYADIPDYLETLTPNPTIYPGQTKGAAKAIENWAHYRLEDIVWQYAVPDIPKTFKDDVERWVFVEMQEIKRGPLEAIEAKRSARKTEMEKHFGILQEMLREHRFLLSDVQGLADFAVFGAIAPLPYSGNNIPGEFKTLRTWWETIDKI
jgi:glutathione S-transferase